MTDPKYMRPGLNFATGKAVEEAGEFLAAAGKAGEFLAAMGKTMRWGWQSVNPELPPEEQETNESWVRREMKDLRGALDNLECEMKDLRGALDNLERELVIDANVRFMLALQHVANVKWDVRKEPCPTCGFHIVTEGNAPLPARGAPHPTLKPAEDNRQWTPDSDFEGGVHDPELPTDY